MRILIIEDNEKLAKSLKKGLEAEGFVADYLTDGESGFRRIEATGDTYEVVILDRMLPRMEGVEISKQLRAKGISIPILMLTAKDTTRDKVEGLYGGADDYLVKPFAWDELLARLRALLRRSETTYVDEIKVGELVLNPNTHRVTQRGKEIQLTQKEYTILSYFMKNQDNVISRQEILDHAWDYEFTSFSNLVDVKIKNLRKKIGDTNGMLIETVRGVGYRLNEK
ncbi:MAG: czcR [Parcubacteria group bacterium]|nr:czcR [Parcubacteria group bacterium]